MSPITPFTVVPKFHELNRCCSIVSRLLQRAQRTFQRYIIFHSSNKRITKMYLITSKKGETTPTTATIIPQYINNENQSFMALKKPLF